jgi:hypothetical protein
MYFYPGGTWWDRATTGHRFWENYLCDLLHQRSLGGAPNLVSARLAEIAMLLMVVSIACALSLATEVIPSRPQLGRRLSQVGTLAALLLVLAPLVPSDRFARLHSVATVFGTLPTLGTFAVLTGALLLEPQSSTRLRGTSLLLLVLLVVCLGLYAWDVYLGGPSLKLLPGLERVATLVVVAWLFAVSRFVRGRLRLAHARAQRTLEVESREQGRKKS